VSLQEAVRAGIVDGSGAELSFRHPLIRQALVRLPRPMIVHDMVRVGLEDHPLTATAALVWSGDLPRPLQQILFDAAVGIAPPKPAWASSADVKVT
jgi:hypothetical protein